MPQPFPGPHSRPQSPMGGPRGLQRRGGACSPGCCPLHAWRLPVLPPPDTCTPSHRLPFCRWLQAAVQPLVAASGSLWKRSVATQPGSSGTAGSAGSRGTGGSGRRHALLATLALMPATAAAASGTEASDLQTLAMLLPDVEEQDRLALYQWQGSSLSHVMDAVLNDRERALQLARQSQHGAQQAAAAAATPAAAAAQALDLSPAPAAAATALQLSNTRGKYTVTACGLHSPEGARKDRAGRLVPTITAAPVKWQWAASSSKLRAAFSVQWAARTRTMQLCMCRQPRRRCWQLRRLSPRRHASPAASQAAVRAAQPSPLMRAPRQLHSKPRMPCWASAAGSPAQTYWATSGERRAASGGSGSGCNRRRGRG